MFPAGESGAEEREVRREGLAGMRVKVPITADYIWIGKDNLPPATVLIIFIMSRSILVLLALLTLSCLSADCPVGSKSQLVSGTFALMQTPSVSPPRLIATPLPKN